MMANRFGDPQLALLGFKQCDFDVGVGIVAWCDFVGFEKSTKVPSRVRMHVWHGVQ